jgi:hypothetical protein
VSPATQEQWWLELYSKVADAGDASSEIIWLTAEPLMEGGTAYYLRDDGDGADYVAGDNEFWARPGGGSMEVQLGSVRFIATNKYLKVDTAYYDLTFKCDSLPTIIVPDTNNGEYISDIIYGYFSGTPTFQWSPFEGAEYYRVALTDTFYHFYVNQEDTLNQNPNLIFWQPSDSLAGTDTCVLYNYDNSASILQLQNYDFTEAEYIFHLTAYQNNAWARREIKVRRVTQD